MFHEINKLKRMTETAKKIKIVVKRLSRRLLSMFLSPSFPPCAIFSALVDVSIPIFRSVCDLPQGNVVDNNQKFSQHRSVFTLPNLLKIFLVPGLMNFSALSPFIKTWFSFWILLILLKWFFFLFFFGGV